MMPWRFPRREGVAKGLPPKGPVPGIASFSVDSSGLHRLPVSRHAGLIKTIFDCQWHEGD
jgi:hypothetical protein